ncbi:MAG: inositol monophosphatase family protein [Myxococcota bacterium]
MDALAWLRFLEEIADTADPIALRYFRSAELRVSEKSDRTPVSEADLRIEEIVRERVARQHPELGVLGEEQGESAAGAERRLILDPIDGTRNFVRGIPIFATLLAIEERGELVAGVVSAPALNTRWSAARGSGARRGSRPLRVSAGSVLARAQLFHGSLGGVEGSEGVPGVLELARRTERQRGFGDFYQHVLVAEGAGEIAVDPVVSPWDVAPLVLLVEEAGGRATSVSGERSVYAGSLVSTNGRLHDEALRVLAASAGGPAEM